jgi:hypothetical protein
MPQGGFEPTIPVFERAKTVHALDRASTGIGCINKQYLKTFMQNKYMLKARTVEPEKQPLLAEVSEITLISRKRRRKRQRNDVRCLAAES